MKCSILCILEVIETRTLVELLTQFQAADV